MEAFVKIYLTPFIIGFIVLVFIVPSIRVYRQTGINPFRFAANLDQADDYIGASMKVFILLLTSTVFVYSFLESVYSRLAPFTYLELPALKIAGLALAHLSMIGIVIAQLQMKQSWRIGIDYENKTQLITTGLFSRSRNPIFFFMIITLLGLFMILSNAITLAVLFTAYFVLEITMRLEEDFLMKQHGEEYLNYRNNVPRLI
jgi:protein-S-isoprenylcysteine O-methyltransferase Ste14